mgnify:CR=1 FL=1
MKKILLLLSGLIGLSAFTMSDNEDLKESIARGKVVYENNCVSCHMADGTGVAGTFPPLAKSDYLTKSTKEAIKGVKYGLQGSIVVNGEEYDSMMPEAGLDDQEVTDVMNYILNTWGNTYSRMITVKEVQEIKRDE